MAIWGEMGAQHPAFPPFLRHVPNWLALPLLWAAMLLPAHADQGQTAWSVRGWRSDTGLPDDEDYDIAQAPDGCIWIATSVGPFRFDGIQFSLVDVPEVSHDFNSTCYVICAARDGSVWWGLNHGRVVRWQQQGHYDIWRVAQGIPNDYPDSICEGRNGAVFVGFRKSGVVEIANGKVTRLDSSNGLPAQMRACLTADADGNVWCAAGSSLFEFRNGAFARIADIPNGWPTGLSLARDGGFWIREDHDVRHLVPGKGIDRTIQIPQALGAASAFHEDAAGNVWIGTWQSPQCGLFLYQGGQLIPEGVDRRQITSIINDREGNIWVTTFEDGIKRLRPRLIRFLKLDPGGMSWGRIRSFARDTAGRLWAVFEDNTVFCLDGGKLEQVPQFSQNAGTIGRAVAVEAAPDGSVVIGTWDKGLFRCNGPQSTPVPIRAPTEARRMVTMLYSNTGDLWVSSSRNGEIARIRHDGADAWQIPDATTAPVMAQGAGGDMLMATDRGRLFHLAGGKIEEIPFPGSGDYRIHGLWRDGDGNVWIGFLGGGLGRLKDGHFIRATARDGLADDYVYQVVPDGLGRIWIISNSGLSRIDVSNFDQFASGIEKRVRVATFGEEEDLDSQAPTRNIGFDTGYCCRVLGDGLWFSYGDGILIVTPGAWPPNKVPPPVVVEAVRVDDRDIPTDANSLRNLTLPPSHSRLEFDFAALSFDMPENNQYRYMIEGYDKQWNEAGNTRQAIYTRLTAGRYRFQVIACNSDGVWNQAGAGVAFTVTPFYWQTWWFQLSVLTVIILCVAVIVRWVAYRRLRWQLRLAEQEAALHKERSRIARDMHDELGASLTRITLMSELASGEPGLPSTATDQLGAIANASRAVSGTLDQIVWTVNPRNDTLERLVGYAGEFASEYLETVGIGLRLELPSDIPSRTVSSDARHQMLLLVKEALNNVAKYANARQVTMQVGFENGSTHIVIADDGSGFDPDTVSPSANGLRNMRQRIAALGGVVEIKSRPGSGTTVTFEAPL